MLFSLPQVHWVQEAISTVTENTVLLTAIGNTGIHTELSLYTLKCAWPTKHLQHSLGISLGTAKVITNKVYFI